MTTATETQIDQFFLMHSSRSDRWREVMSCAEAWVAGKRNKATSKAHCAVYRFWRSFMPIRDSARCGR